MEIELIPDITNTFGEARLAELTAIAENHYDGRVTLEQMLESLHSSQTFLQDKEMMFIESLLRKKLEGKEDSLDPVVHGIRFGYLEGTPYREMLETQITGWTGVKPLYAKVLLENPGYPKHGVLAGYEVGIELEGGEIFSGHDHGVVSMEKDQKYCIARFEIFNPCDMSREEEPVNHGRVFVRDSATKNILASHPLDVISAPDHFTRHIKISKAYIYEGHDNRFMFEKIAKGSRSELNFHIEFRHSMTGLEAHLPEIEVELDTARNEELLFMAKTVLKAKCHLKDGEAVYIAEGTFLDRTACKGLKPGGYQIGVLIWGENICEGEFHVGEKLEEKEVTPENQLQFTVYDYIGKDYGKPVKGDAGQDAPADVKRAHEYITLNTLNLFRQDYIDNLKPDDNVEGQTTFKEGFNCDIAIYSSFTFVRKFDNADEMPVTYNLYDSTGRLVQTVEGSQSIDKDADGNELFFSSGNFSTEETSWPKGMYRVESIGWGETLISIKFEICEKDTYGMFDPAASQPRIGQGGLKIVKEVSDARRKLDELIGLRSVKEKIASLGEVSQFAALRQKAGLSFKKASLHARFIGSSGTGKTTVAKLIGQIYKEMGLLSSGHVVFEERRTLIGRYYDSELRETERALRNAQGGVLFIDEAYGLYVEEDPKDPGHKVIEALLTALADEDNRDWMLILAGYPDDMEQLMNSNEGLNSRVSDVFFFDEMSRDELVEVADLYCRRNEYIMTPEAHRALESVIARDYASRSKTFGNARYVNNLLEKKIVPAMASRVCSLPAPRTIKQLKTIEKEDVPAMRKLRDSKNLGRLEEMVGLEDLKQSITSHLNFVQMVNYRMSMGIHTEMPPLHMIFTGNPGTGKSTVADFMGEIYASMGILSRGEVIKVEKRDLVGKHVGETEDKMNDLLERAKGNVLFIDEAYQLWSNEDSNDYGKIVLESLLAVLANDQLDMIVILAGYTAEMERLIKMNSGIESRFPYTFHFEDYTADELIEIADITVEKANFILSPEARERLLELIQQEIDRNKDSFGNARFVKRLISTKVLPAMADRINKLKEPPTEEVLKTIIAEDIPDSPDGSRFSHEEFDEEAISKALERLDSMVGLRNVKKTIHNFVEVARYISAERQEAFGNQLMKWNFVGNSGTGKSTVAQIMADILKAMGLIDKGKVVELKGEEFYNVPEYRCDEILRKAMEDSKYGLLFIDSDAPMFRNANSWALTGDQLRIKLAALTAEIGGNGALIIAECEPHRPSTGPSLAGKGVFDLDRTLVFEDYTADELYEILVQQLQESKAKLSAEAEAKMRTYINALCDNRSLAMANARTMKLLAQSILQIMLLRESRDPEAAKGLVTAEDVESFEWHKPYKKIGF